MGAMNCSRCDSPMCDVYISEVGYVCYGCQQAFKEWLEKTGRNPQTEGEIIEALNEFKKVQEGSTEKISVDEFFKKHDRN